VSLFVTSFVDLHQPSMDIGDRAVTFEIYALTFCYATTLQTIGSNTVIVLVLYCCKYEGVFFM